MRQRWPLISSPLENVASKMQHIWGETGSSFRGGTEVHGRPGLISETSGISGKHIWGWNPVRGREKARAATPANPGRARCWQQQTRSPIPYSVTCRGSQCPPRSEQRWCSHTYTPGLLGRLSEARLGHVCSPAKPTLQAVSLAFSIFSFSIFKFYLFFTFLDVLSLCCCAWTFPSCGEQSLLRSCNTQVSLWWLLLLQNTGARAQVSVAVARRL